MKEHPIIFSGAMVRAILDGRKTQTRRVLHLPEDTEVDVSAGTYTFYNREVGQKTEIHPLPKCPYGQTGDLLYVKETFTATRDRQTILYRADPFYQDMPKGDSGRDWNWTAPRFMPRWASRIDLEVTDVRAVRLQDITEEEALADGMSPEIAKPFMFAVVGGDPITEAFDPIHTFWNLWDSINGKKPGHSWASNPWVFDIEFRRLS